MLRRLNVSKALTKLEIKHCRIDLIKKMKNEIREELFHEFSEEAKSKRVIDHPFIMKIFEKEHPEEEIRIFEGKLRWRG